MTYLDFPLLSKFRKYIANGSMSWISLPSIDPKRFKNSKNFDDLKQDYLNLLHYAQLTNYREITSIAKRIDINIGSRDDQESLYLKLTEILNVSDKFNKMLAPQIQIELQKLIDKMENEQDSSTMVAMTKEISSLFVSQ